MKTEAIKHLFTTIAEIVKTDKYEPALVNEILCRGLCVLRGGLLRRLWTVSAGGFRQTGMAHEDNQRAFTSALRPIASIPNALNENGVSLRRPFTSGSVFRLTVFHSWHT